MGEREYASSSWGKSDFKWGEGEYLHKLFLIENNNKNDSNDLGEYFWREQMG